MKTEVKHVGRGKYALVRGDDRVNDVTYDSKEEAEKVLAGQPAGDQPKVPDNDAAVRQENDKLAEAAASKVDGDAGGEAEITGEKPNLTPQSAEDKDQGDVGVTPAPHNPAASDRNADGPAPAQRATDTVDLDHATKTTAQLMEVHALHGVKVPEVGTVITDPKTQTDYREGGESLDVEPSLHDLNVDARATNAAIREEREGVAAKIEAVLKEAYGADQAARYMPSIGAVLAGRLSTKGAGHRPLRAPVKS